MRNRFLYQNLPMYGIADGQGGTNFRQIDTPLDAGGEDDSGQGNGNPSPSDGDVSLDQADILAQLWGTENDDNLDGDDDSGDGTEDDDNPDDADDGQQQTRQQGKGKNQQRQAADPGPDAAAAESAAMVKQLGIDINALAHPADFLPADFDPSNREHLTTAFNKAQQYGASNTMRLLFPIMDKANKALRAAIMADVSKSLNGRTSEARVRAMLEAEIPEVNDPKLGRFVETVFKQARARHGNKTSIAIASTRKALAALGVKIGDSSGSPLPAGVQRQRGQSGGRSGAETLDQFFQMPSRNAVQQRMSNNGNKR